MRVSVPFVSCLRLLYHIRNVIRYLFHVVVKNKSPLVKNPFATYTIDERRCSQTFFSVRLKHCFFKNVSQCTAQKHCMIQTRFTMCGAETLFNILRLRAGVYLWMKKFSYAYFDLHLYIFELFAYAILGSES